MVKRLNHRKKNQLNSDSKWTLYHFSNKKSNFVMENFTDLFGDDLTGLDGLGDLGNFGGANTGAPGGPPANAPQVHT